MKPKLRFPRRPYDTQSFLELVQCDLGEMFPSNGYKYFLLIIDVYTNKMWCYNLKSKDTKTVRKAFDEFFAETGDLPTQISTDQGKLKLII